MAQEDSRPGRIGWVDITVDDAPGLKAFYQAVTGWGDEGVDMGGYQDWCMLDDGGNAVAGICHARGVNADLPPQWLVYINVADLDGALAAVAEGGGEQLKGPTSMGTQGRYAVIRDPSGAACALFEPAQPS